MSDGWRPLKAPEVGAEAFVASAFARLARAHAIAVAGDTLVAIALAGTLFFSIDVGQARSEVFLYLALTMAPFSVIAPLVGPALDRSVGGRRWMVIGSSALRAMVCALMIRDVDSLLLFPEALTLLVLAKGYQVAKSALVPTTVDSDTALVEANSKLSLISGLVGFVAAVPGALLLRFGGAEWVLALASVVFAVGVYVSWQVPKASVAVGPVSEEEREELRGAGVLLAASSMGLLRGIVGFLAFLLAFALRTDGAPTWHFGVVLALSAVGQLGGSGLAPVLRRHTSEERIIAGALGAVALFALIAAVAGGLVGAAIVAGAVGLAAASAKQAFDSIVQRDAPDANRGRSFARFETRFQLIWVAGAVAGLVPMPMPIGFLAVCGVAGFAAVSYLAGARGTSDVAARIRQRRLKLRRRGAASIKSRGTREIVPDGPTRRLSSTAVEPATPTPDEPAIRPDIDAGADVDADAGVDADTGAETDAAIPPSIAMPPSRHPDR